MMKTFLAFTVTLFVGFFASASPLQNNSDWKIVPNQEVCMVTNMHFARPQIPVLQDGKTYYGCCENCQATIQKDPASRTATDPLTQKAVDKAKATIAANGHGAVLYFESRTNFDRYLKQTTGKVERASPKSSQ